MTMKNIHAEIEIKAPIEKVWTILMDFNRYPDWNPFVKSIEGKAERGSGLKIVLHQPESKPMTIKPKCMVVEKNSEFRWKGKLLIPGIFDGEHIFKMRDAGNGMTKFIQTENFGGLLLPLFWKMINTKTIKGFEEMNRALKQRAEASE
jgi:hypothetical protein